MATFDDKVEAIFSKHLQPGETLLHYVFAEEHGWHWTRLLGLRRFRLLASTDQRVLVSEVGSMGFSEKATHGFSPGQYKAKVERLEWRENGLKVGEGRLVTLAAADGARYELRVAPKFAGLARHDLSFNPLMTMLAQGG